MVATYIDCAGLSASYLWGRSMEQSSSRLVRWVAIALCALALNAAKRPQAPAETLETTPAMQSDRQAARHAATVAANQTDLR